MGRLATVDHAVTRLLICLCGVEHRPTFRGRVQCGCGRSHRVLDVDRRGNRVIGWRWEGR